MLEKLLRSKWGNALRRPLNTLHTYSILRRTFWAFESCESLFCMRYRCNIDIEETFQVSLRQTVFQMMASPLIYSMMFSLQSLYSNIFKDVLNLSREERPSLLKVKNTFDETMENLRNIYIQEHPQYISNTQYFIIFAKNEIHEDHRMPSMEDRSLHHFSYFSSTKHVADSRFLWQGKITCWPQIRSQSESSDHIDATTVTSKYHSPPWGMGH